MANSTTKRVYLLVIALVAFLGVLLLLVFPQNSQPPAGPLPNPNGYGDFMAAAKLLPSGDVPSAKMSSTEELRAYVTNNTAALERVRAGLKIKSRVPTGYSQSYLQFHMDELALEKRLIRAMAAEGALAERENRPADAARIYTEMVRLGREFGRGGLLIDEMVSMSCISISMEPFQKLVPQMDAQSSRLALLALDEIVAGYEPFSGVLNREKAFAKKQGFQIGMTLVRLFRDPNGPAIQKTLTKRQSLERVLRQLQVKLASRAYELEKGGRPVSYKDLVPDYLGKIPVDPETKAEMEFLP